LYVERLIERPYHIEVQIFADGHGNIVHLFERECSTQRRHQKIIEESPSPNVSPELRQQITGAAVRIARAASYRNAGTVEFLVDPSQHEEREAAFYFLEVNARLQVEHAVTEQLTGVDLVRAQLLVAAGEELPWSQHEVTARGHAIEARIYAEDPANDFAPQSGPLVMYREPRVPGVRIDSGVREGDRISIYYDPLLAKVTASGETRPHALARLIAALRDFPILGVQTNVPFLIRVLESEEFRAGRIHTHFLDAEGHRLRGESPEMPPIVRAAWAAVELTNRPGRSGPPSTTAADPWDELRGWRNT
jgi:acetyl/propionyl-CoA carboxylase alpha subunit